jgi:hypothetical protein
MEMCSWTKNGGEDREAYAYEEKHQICDSGPVRTLRDFPNKYGLNSKREEVINKKPWEGFGPIGIVKFDRRY